MRLFNDEELIDKKKINDIEIKDALIYIPWKVKCTTGFYKYDEIKNKAIENTAIKKFIKK